MGEVDEAVYKERDDSLGRAATTASSLEAKQDNGTTLVDETTENQGRFNDEEMFNAGVLDVSTAKVTTAGIEATTVSATTTTADDLTLAQTLIEIRSARPKAKGIVFRETGESITTIPQQQPLKDKGKGLMVEPEKPTKRKEQIRLDE
ncbi:hypothetical protein Tco_1560421, partial [Tanacetum coccineum]